MSEFTDGLEIEGKGEKRLTPVDVDVLDNLINAQAAFIEAWSVAMAHLGGGAEITEEALHETRSALQVPMGQVLTEFATQRA